MSYLDERREHINKGRPLPEPKKPKWLKPVSDKLAAKRAAQKVELGGEETDLQKWFNHFMEISEPVCAECGTRADWVKLPGNEKIWRACQAHILSKKKNFGFPSLATNLDNHIVLFPSWGGHLCGDHGFYDSGWYNASTMKIWPNIVKMFKTKLNSLIPAHERKNIPDALLKELEIDAV